MEKTKLLPIDYCSIDRAAELLTEATGKTVKPEDIEHWILKNKIIPCVDMTQLNLSNGFRTLACISINYENKELVHTAFPSKIAKGKPYDDVPYELINYINSSIKHSKIYHCKRSSDPNFDKTKLPYWIENIELTGIWRVAQDSVGELLQPNKSRRYSPPDLFSIPNPNFPSGYQVTIHALLDKGGFKITKKDLVIIQDDLQKLETHINLNEKLHDIDNYTTNKTIEEHSSKKLYKAPKHEPNSKHSSTLIKAISALSAYIPEALYDELEEQFPNKYQLFVNVIKNIDELDDHMLTLPYSVLGHINDFLKSKKTNPLVPTTKTVAKWVEKGKSNQW